MQMTFDHLCSQYMKLCQDLQLANGYLSKLDTVQPHSIDTILSYAKLLGPSSSAPMNFDARQELGPHKLPFPSEELIRNGILFQKNDEADAFVKEFLSKRQISHEVADFDFMEE
ncbi:hypothetical protein RCL1_003683 [Eukaryota sp. TZLM3-RCL]